MAEEITTMGKSSVLPFLLGGLAGAGVIVLLAPESRKLSSSTIKNSALSTARRISTAVTTGKERYEKGKKALPEVVQKSKNMYEEQKGKIAELSQSVSGVIQQGKSLYEEQKEKIKEMSQSVSTVLEKGKSVFDEQKKKMADLSESTSATIQKGKSLFGEQKQQLGELAHLVKTAVQKEPGEEQGKEAATVLKPSSSLLLPIVAGTAAGIGLAFIFSGESGKNLRKNVTKIVVSTGKQLADVYEDSKSKVSDAIETGKQRIQEKRAA